MPVLSGSLGLCNRSDLTDGFVGDINKSGCCRLSLLACESFARFGSFLFCLYFGRLLSFYDLSAVAADRGNVLPSLIDPESLAALGALAVFPVLFILVKTFLAEVRYVFPLCIVADRYAADLAGLLFPLGLFLGILLFQILKPCVKTVPCFLNFVPEDLLGIKSFVERSPRFIKFSETGLLGFVDLGQFLLHRLCH